MIFFVIAFGSIRRNLYRPGEPAVATYLSCVAALALGFALLALCNTARCSSTASRSMRIPAVIGSVPLNTIIAVQFVQLLAILGIIAAFTIRRTGTSLPGALICALFVTGTSSPDKRRRCHSDRHGLL